LIQPEKPLNRRSGGLQARPFPLQGANLAGLRPPANFKTVFSMKSNISVQKDVWSFVKTR
jgi:hypothetical protein